MRITDEQAEARDELAEAAPGYRLTRDPGDAWPMVPGRYGRLEHLGASVIAAFTDRRLIRARLLAVPGVTSHQVGQEELRVLVAPEAVAPVLQLLRCFRRRRPMPEAQRRAAGEWFAKARQAAGGQPRGAPIAQSHETPEAKKALEVSEEPSHA